MRKKIIIIIRLQLQNVACFAYILENVSGRILLVMSGLAGC